MIGRHPRRAVLAALAFGLAAQAFAADLVSEQVVVAGALQTTLTLTPDDLKAFPAAQIASVTVTRRVDDKEVASTVRGVRLTAVLERAGLAFGNHNEWKYTFVPATATDGCRVVFSWPELFNTEVGAGALVIVERDGQPLADREGRIALVSVRDQRSGPRSVRGLARLDVRVVTE